MAGLTELELVKKEQITAQICGLLNEPKRQLSHPKPWNVAKTTFKLLTTSTGYVACQSVKLTVLHLNVVVRVPVWVKDDDGVCCGQVYTQTSCSGGEQKTKLTGARSWNHKKDEKGWEITWTNINICSLWCSFYWPFHQYLQAGAEVYLNEPWSKTITVWWHQNILERFQVCV